MTGDTVVPPRRVACATAASNLSTPMYISQCGGTLCFFNCSGRVITPPIGTLSLRVHIEYGMPAPSNGVVVQPTTGL